MRILLVEDEPSAAGMLAKGLREEAYAVDVAADGERALELAFVNDYDLVILDVMLPRKGGFEVCRELRASGSAVPVLMLTARDAVEDRVTGLDSGADDYLSKPFDFDELLARVRALLRRAQPEDDGTAALRFGDLVLDPVGCEVHRGDRRIELTRTEFLLLELFMRHPRQVLTRTQIFERVWGYDFGPTSNSLGVYVGYLRRKLEAGGEPRLLHTVRGLGYVLRA